MMNKNKQKKIYQNLQGAAKSLLREKIIAINASIK